MIALLLVISARLVDLMREEEMALTVAEATGLAEHFGQSSTLPDEEEYRNATKWLNSAKRGEIAVRVWDLAGQGFQFKWSNVDQGTMSQVPADIASKLLANRMHTIE